MVIPRRLAVIGTGLIGGSVGLAARQAGIEVVGFDADSEALESAVERGAIDRAAGTVEEAVGDVELVVLATPVDLIPQLCAKVAVAVAPEAVVTDVGSAKERVVVSGTASFGPRFVGGHPM